MSAKHTTGPWQVALDSSHPAEYGIDAVIDGMTWHIALVHVIASDEEAEANAKLIAAAPELLEALKQSAEGWANAIELKLLPPQHVLSASILRDSARAAIDKALPAGPARRIDGSIDPYLS